MAGRARPALLSLRVTGLGRPRSGVGGGRHNARVSSVEIRNVGYDHPDSERLIAEVQAEYVIRYGGPDASPVDPTRFADPHGVFAVGYLDGEPVAMGGWRRHDPADPATGWAAPAAEIKRMYVADAARGRGFARALLAHLERTSREQGIAWLLLETGLMQPEAISLYESAGYRPVPPFGHYADSTHSVHLGKQLG